LATLGAAGALFLTVANAASPSGRIVSVDTSNYPRIGLTVVSSAVLSRAPLVTENGSPVTALTGTSLSEEKSIVLAVDRSESMHGRSLADAVAAARAFVAAKSPSDRIAVVTFASRARFVSQLSATAANADAALRSIRVDTRYGTTLNDAIVQAATALKKESSGGRVIILVTDGQETTSKATLKDAIKAARQANAAVYPIAIRSNTFSPAPLRRLALQTGGSYYAAAKSSALRAIYTAIANVLRRTWRLQYLTAARPGDQLNLRVAGPDTATTTRFRIPGSSHPQSSSAISTITMLLLLALAAIGLTLLIPRLRHAHYR
jgi:VWFA-related protein